MDSFGAYKEKLNIVSFPTYIINHNDAHTLEVVNKRLFYNAFIHYRYRLQHIYFSIWFENYRKQYDL